MRPPTNQSIRRHLSDCSLTSGCPVPPSLLVARTICLLCSSPTGSGPMPDTHARVDRVFDAYQRERGRRMWTDRRWTRRDSLRVSRFGVPKREGPLCRRAILINARLSYGWRYVKQMRANAALLILHFDCNRKIFTLLKK